MLALGWGFNGSAWPEVRAIYLSAFSLGSLRVPSEPASALGQLRQTHPRSSFAASKHGTN